MDISRLNRIRAAVQRAGALKKSAAAVLTPEAEQAAVQAPPDPAMAQAAEMPASQPGDPAMQGAAPQATGSGGGQIPPEILQDQQFIMWLQQQGVILDQQSGMFIDQASGQPLPADAIMQAYQVYQEQMAASQGAVAAAPQAAAQPDAGAPPAVPAVPQQEPAAAPAAQPQEASAAEGAQGGQIPPEILQDQAFMDFMTQAMGAQFDQQSGMFIDPSSGQPIPPELVVQAYQQFQQQMGGEQGAQQAPAAQSAGEQAAPGQLPPELLEQLQSTIDASIQNYTAQLDKKIETLLDKLETVKQALESMRDTDDERSADSKKEAQALRDEIAADLMPSMPSKTAAENSTQGRKSGVPRPINMLELLRGK